MINTLIYAEGESMPVSIYPRQASVAKTGQNPSFKSAEKEKEAKYSDPLLKWPARGLAYSNELGAAISEVAPTLGTLLWFPAMLYFGADIYDKYKNDKTSYNPSGIRGTEQAAFQALASVILPTGAVIAGQKITSVFGKFGKTGLSLQTQENLINFLQGHMNRRNIAEYKDNIEGFKDSFKTALINHVKKEKTELKTANPIKLIRNFANYMKYKQHPESIEYSPKIMKFTNAKIDEIFSIYEQLEANDLVKPKEFSNKIFKQYNKIKEKFLNDAAYKDTAKADAIELILKKYKKSKIMNAKLLKTAGGFAALGLAINPIDNFVEHVVMKKFIAPRLKELEQSKKDYSKKQQKGYKNKFIH